jgi:ABC-type Mn2+/Zn2+ transport system ATPase subunit
MIFHVLQRLAEQGRTVIVTTHDLGILPIHFSRAVFLDGHVVADGPVAEVLTAETIARAYGVRLCTDDEEAPALDLHAHLAG